jgi:hypothetical protein
MAFAYNKKQAVMGVYSNPEMNYENVLVTQDSMEGAFDPDVELIGDGLSFTWDCPASLPWPRPYDQVMMLG